MVGYHPAVVDSPTRREEEQRRTTVQPPLHPTPSSFVASPHRSRQDNPAREALTIKCVRVIVENFEHLPAHDATGGLNVCGHPDDDDNDDVQQETKGGDGVSAAGGETTFGGQVNALSNGGGVDIGAVSGDGIGESKLEAGEDGQAPQQQQRQQRERKVIPAKFLQLISAGLSTDLDPKV